MVSVMYTREKRKVRNDGQCVMYTRQGINMKTLTLTLTPNLNPNPILILILILTLTLNLIPALQP
jgi:hypothetical protein